MVKCTYHTLGKNQKKNYPQFCLFYLPNVRWSLSIWIGPLADKNLRLHHQNLDRYSSLNLCHSFEHNPDHVSRLFNHMGKNGNSLRVFGGLNIQANYSTVLKLRSLCCRSECFGRFQRLNALKQLGRYYHPNYDFERNYPQSYSLFYEPFWGNWKNQEIYFLRVGLLY